MARYGSSRSILIRRRVSNFKIGGICWLLKSIHLLRHLFFDLWRYLGEQKGFKTKEDWYKISGYDLRKIGGRNLVEKHFDNMLWKFVTKVCPKWNLLMIITYYIWFRVFQSMIFALGYLRIAQKESGMICMCDGNTYNIQEKNDRKVNWINSVSLMCLQILRRKTQFKNNGRLVQGDTKGLLRKPRRWTVASVWQVCLLFFVVYFVDLAYAILCWSHLFFFLIFNLGLFSPFLFIFVLKERGPHHRSCDVWTSVGGVEVSFTKDSWQSTNHG